MYEKRQALNRISEIGSKAKMISRGMGIKNDVSRGMGIKNFPSYSFCYYLANMLLQLLYFDTLKEKRLSHQTIRNRTQILAKLSSSSITFLITEVLQKVASSSLLKSRFPQILGFIEQEHFSLFQSLIILEVVSWNLPAHAKSDSNKKIYSKP